MTFLNGCLSLQTLHQCLRVARFKPCVCRRYMNIISIFILTSSAFRLPFFWLVFMLIFVRPLTPINVNAWKISRPASKTPIFDVLTTRDIDWGQGVQVNENLLTVPTGYLDADFCQWFFSFDSFTSKKIFEKISEKVFKNIF